jgi:branched-chain amino acid transport system permease protein/urea transport system permease protein
MSATLAVALPIDSFNIIVLMATYVLIALGLHYSFGLLNIVNLVHGEFLLVGAYTAFAIQAATGSVLLGMAIAPVVAAALAAVAERSVLARLKDRVLDTLLATFGIALLLRQGIQVLYTANPRSVTDPISRSLTVAGFVVPLWRLTVVIVTIVLVTMTALLLARTSAGLRWRATVRNPELAETLGIDTARARTVLFALGSGVAGLAGAVLAPLNTVTPQFGTRFLVPAFLVTILGGQGSLRGLVIAGVLLGGTLGALQFTISSVSAQMLVVLLAIAGIRLRDTVIAAIARGRRIEASEAS